MLSSELRKYAYANWPLEERTLFILQLYPHVFVIIHCVQELKYTAAPYGLVVVQLLNNDSSTRRMTLELVDFIEPAVQYSNTQLNTCVLFVMAEKFDVGLKINLLYV